MVVDGYSSLLAVAIIIVAYLDLGNFLHVVSGGVFVPKYAYFALAGAVVPLLILRTQALKAYLTSPFVPWAAGMFALNVAHWFGLSWDGDVDAASLTLTRIQFLVLTVLLGFVLLQTRPVRLGKAFIAVAVILTALQIIDFTFPGALVPLGTQGVVLGRAGSTLINANKAAESLILLAVLGMAVLPPIWRFALLLFVLPGIFLSFSRSGMIIWSLVVASSLFFRLLPRSTPFLSLAILLTLISLFGDAALQALLDHVDPGAVQNVLDRVLFLLTFQTGDFSAQERSAVIGYALRSFFDQPILGNGAGYTFAWSYADVSSHNQHLLMLAEYGVIGYAFLIWLLVLMLKGGAYFKEVQAPRLSVVAVLVFVGFSVFTHNMFDFLYWLISIALLSHRRFYFVREATLRRDA